MASQYLVGYDGSAAARRAVDFAIERAQESGASVLIAHVLEWSPYSFLTPEELEERHKRRSEELARAKTAVIVPMLEAVKSKGIKTDSVIKYGHVADTLCAIATEAGAAEIFIGRTGHAGVAARIFGSVAGSLAQISPVPCTIVP